MGQLSSSINFHDSINFVQDAICRQARTVSETSMLSYDEFLSYLTDMNELSKKCMDAEGRQLMFFIKPGTGDGIFWKTDVKIYCVRFHAETKTSDIARVMSLVQFLRLYRGIKIQLEATCTTSSEEASGGTQLKTPTTSELIKVLDLEAENSEVPECCICFERPHEIVLPCMHSFCEICISWWNEKHKTCPICRKDIGYYKDMWVISDIPRDLEMGEELVASVMDIVNTTDNE